MNTVSTIIKFPHKMRYVTAALMFMVLISCAGRTLHTGRTEPDHGNAETAVSEYDRAGRYIVNALSSGDAEAFRKSVLKTSLIDRTFKGITESRESMKAKASLDKVIDRAGHIMTAHYEKNARLKFIRTRPFRGEHYALVRVNTGDGGLSYLDFILEKDMNGDVRIADWYDYSQGQLYSASLRQTIGLLFPETGFSMDGLPGIPGVNGDHMEQLAELAGLSAEGKFEGWLRMYKTLPDSLKYSRIVLITRVLITSAMGSGDEYRMALKDVKRYLGDDPALSLMLVDHYVIERDYVSAHEALDRLDEYTGGDAAIDFLKANLCLTEKKYHLSVRHAQGAIQQDNDLEDAYWTLLVASIYSKEYDISVHTLKELEHRFRYVFDPEELSRMNGYEDFAKSAAFAFWKDERLAAVDRSPVQHRSN